MRERWPNERKSSGRNQRALRSSFGCLRDIRYTKPFRRRPAREFASITAGICRRWNGVQAFRWNGVQALVCTAAILSRPRPLWVRSGHWSTSAQCLLYPQKRTLELSRGMSALCQKQTFCSAANCSLFDHFVGAADHRLWHGNAERLGGLEVDDQLIPGRRLDRKVGGLLAFEDAIDVFGRAPERIHQITPIGHQAAACDERALEVDRRQLVPGCQLDDQLSMSLRRGRRRHD